jgi:hypothetical protein
VDIVEGGTDDEGERERERERERRRIKIDLLSPRMGV